MSDCQVITSSIRAYLATSAGGDGPAAAPWSDDLPDLAAAYSDLCREANVRLHRCADYRRRGMRSEAVHLADCQPKLLDMVAALNFPERPRWAAACGAYRLPAPPALLTEGLEELRAAYAREQELAPLLSRHRALALARSLLRERIAVARLLAGADADNPCWPAEVRSLEASRVEEIRVESRTALRANDAAAVIERLWAEITEVPWLEFVPEDLREELEAAVGSIRRQQALAELAGLAPRLAAVTSTGRDVHGTDGDGDSDVGRDGTADGAGDELLVALIARWHELMETPGLEVPAPIVEQARPALEWEAAEAERQVVRQETKAFSHLLREDGHAAPASDDADHPPRRRWLLAVAAAAVMLAAAGAAWYAYAHGYLSHFRNRL